MDGSRVSLWTEESSDAELIASVRAGESAAFGVLFERHGSAARRVAGMYSSVASDIDDVVSEAFARVLKALQQGDGPDMAFRAYLFTVVRRTGLDLIAKGKRTRPDEDMSNHDAAIGYERASDEPALDNFEQSVVADAFRSLPERWQVVLWYTEIEKKAPAEIAPLLGLSPNGVAALAYRAREALRQAYLQQHLATTDDVDCLAVSENLAGFVRGGLTKRERAKVEAHVKVCDRCSALVGELEDVNRGLRGVIAPLILGLLGVGALETSLPIGGVGAGHLAAGAGGAAGGATGGVATGIVGGAVVGTGGAAMVGAASGTSAHSSSVLSGVLANTFGSGSSLLSGIAATVGVTALAVASAGLVGTLNYHDPLDEPAGGSVVEFILGSPSGLNTVDLPIYVPADRDQQTDDPAVPSVSDTPAPSGSSSGSGGSGGSGGPGASGGSDDPGGSGGSDDPGGSGGALDVQLSLFAGATGVLELPRTDPTIPIRVGNAGGDGSTPVTLTVTLPDGLSFPSAGGGTTFGAAIAPRLSDWLHATAGVDVDGWTCTYTATVATCERDSLAASSKVTLSLPVEISGTLADDASTSFGLSDEDGHASSVALPTSLAPDGRKGTLLYAAEGSIDVAVSGAPLMTCDTSDKDCQKALDFNGNAVKTENNNNSWDMQEVNSEGGTRNSASSTLSVPSDATVLKAFVVWSANRGPSDGFTSDPASARLRPPGASSYIDITADTVQTWTDPGGRVYYQARADVTDLVQAYGGGAWALADIAVADGRTDTNPSYYAGFALTSVYEKEGLPDSSVAVYGGGDVVTKDDDADYTFAVDDESDVDVTTVAWEGDRGIDGDTLTLDGEKLTSEHTSSGGAISTGDKDNAFDSTAIGSGVANSMGTDAKSFKTETVDAGEHKLTASTEGDNLAVGIVVVKTTSTGDSTDDDAPADDSADDTSDD